MATPKDILACFTSLQLKECISATKGKPSYLNVLITK